jgi:hypothetical protein
MRGWTEDDKLINKGACFMFYNGNDILYDGFKNCVQEKYVPWALEYYTL